MDQFLTRALLKIRDETRARGDSTKSAKRLVDGCSEALGQARWLPIEIGTPARDVCARAHPFAPEQVLLKQRRMSRTRQK